jgi:hypothetical protein
VRDTSRRTEELKTDSDSEKKEHEVVTKAGSVAGDSFDAAEEEDELDPVALNKAFKFASYSSVGLVWHLRSSVFPDRQLIAFLAVYRPYHPRPSSPLLLPLRLHHLWLDRLGCRWYCLDLLFCHHGGALSPL